MELPFASQDNRIKLFAAVSSALLGILIVIAGTLLMFTDRVSADWGTEMPQLYQWVSGLGLTALVIDWLLYMAALVFLLGHRATENRILLVIACLVVCLFYAFAVLVGAFVPYLKVSFAVM